MIDKLGATPFIPFKSNSVEPTDGSAWARMHHLSAYRRAEVLSHYDKRSNVETMSAMMKAKFGDSLLSKTEDSQTNEDYVGALLSGDLSRSRIPPE